VSDPVNDLAMPSRLGAAGLWAGPAIALGMLFAGTPEGLPPAGWTTLALLAWMAVWWITEAVPVAMTALLPLALLPLLGAATPAAAAAPYADPIIYLFIGGFMLAMAIERWGLHTRIALAVAGGLGTRPIALVAGFLLAAALLSMWISNTATALMLMPTAIGVVRATTPAGAEPSRRFAAALVLAVAYGASIGGIGTPVGSPTNLVAMGYLERNGLSLAFVDWMLLALPIMVAMLAAAWALLAFEVRGVTHGTLAARDAIARERARLGTMSAPERRVALVFGGVALAWMASPWLSRLPGLGALNDTTIALLGALVLFILPSGDAVRRGRLLDWATAERLPWGVALLFGGGLSMAAAMNANGVTAWLADSMGGVGTLAPLVVLLLLVAVTVFASELASNTATLSAVLPVVGAFSIAAGLPTLELAFAASMAASLAFMLPIGTPPNAIAYATGWPSMATMCRIGLGLNLVAIPTIALLSHWLSPWVLPAP
jgi:sodium-dependent dicarboxylate transporter 2/3/5